MVKYLILYKYAILSSMMMSSRYTNFTNMDCNILPKLKHNFPNLEPFSVLCQMLTLDHLFFREHEFGNPCLKRAQGTVRQLFSVSICSFF